MSKNQDSTQGQAVKHRYARIDPANRRIDWHEADRRLTLEELQAGVGGYIERVRVEIDGREFDLIIDEEGRLKQGMPYWELRDDRMPMGFVGPGLLFGGEDGSGEFSSCDLDAARLTEAVAFPALD